MNEQSLESNFHLNFVQHNIRELLDSNLPTQITQLEESTVSLERVAAYCEANYIQSQNKPAALAETKRYALQSLASVAYLIGDLSRSLLHALELEQLNLAQKTSEIQNINQLVAIQKEKAARREIGKLTTAKNVIRQKKITYPATEERTSRYQRSAIDFSILDGVGHGCRVAPSNNEYGTIVHAIASGIGLPIMMQVNRTASNTSGESGGGSGSGGSSGMHNGPIYEHYARTGNHGTLTRGSIRSALNTMHEQYRVPQPIPSAIQQQQIYQQQQRYASTIAINGHGSNGNNNNYYDYEQYGTLRAAPLRQQPAVGHQFENGVNNQQHLHAHANNVDPMNNSADYSDDGLPLPPPLLLTGPTGQLQQHNATMPNQDDDFPLPPMTEANRNNAVNHMPPQYIEKAYVLYDYESRNPDELRLYQGAIVYVLRKNEDGWFEGVMDGITGLFPGNYVQAIAN